ncbi:MAG: PTS sugar transporter subunit IIA [Treponema sp.]|nr:PTS sugar transporter subunit IIA [Treponema sp.]MCL2191630.1 PTS sugar transporter subunit IIA [Treponema sp.]
MLEDTILTIEEVAQYLRVSERTVYEWAQKGEIPAGKIGTVWRFKKSEIMRWVNERLSAGRFGYQFNPVQIQAILSPERILFLDFPSKRDVLLELAKNLATAPQIKNSQELASEIVKREELMSTAIGKGIAIPHIRLQSVTDLVVSIGISRVDVADFNPLDDEPVRFILMIAAAYNQHASYLQTLSFFSSKLKDRDLRDSLLQSKTADEVYGLLAAIPVNGPQ